MCNCGNNGFTTNNLSNNSFNNNANNLNGVYNAGNPYVVGTLSNIGLNPVQNIDSSNYNQQSNLNRTLQSYLGRRVCCEFALVGNNLIRRSGILSEVGSDFIRLTSATNCADTLLCDTRDLVFIRIE